MTRELDMCALYRSGKTLQEIGDQYGLTRERVRQLIARHGISAKNGGARVRARRDRVKRLARKDERYLRKLGCTFAQYVSLRDMAKSSYYTGPLGAFACQKNNAARRGIQWELSLWQWWTIWRESGHWEQRGRGQGYVMARKSDEGPYAVGNVYITTAIDNCSDAPKKRKYNLPTGVAHKNGRYIAHRMLLGKSHYLGAHDTPELAHAAYLNASVT